jgi:hypothetical protein
MHSPLQLHLQQILGIAIRYLESKATATAGYNAPYSDSDIQR